MNPGAVFAVAGLAVCAVAVAGTVWSYWRLPGTSAGVSLSAACLVAGWAGAVIAVAGAVISRSRGGLRKAGEMNIKITYRRDADHPQHGGNGGEQWAVEADGIENCDGDRVVQAVLDAGALMKAAAYGNAKLIVEGLKGFEGRNDSG